MAIVKQQPADWMHIKSKKSPRVPNALELEVCKCTAEILASPVAAEHQSELGQITISKVKEITVSGMASRRAAVVVFVPYRKYRQLSRQALSIYQQEMEKKLKRYVFVIEQMQIFSESYVAIQWGMRKAKVERAVQKNSGIESNIKIGTPRRPWQRTLSAVYDKIMIDLVSPVDIVGRREKFTYDDKTKKHVSLHKVFIDEKEKVREKIEERLEVLKHVYKSLTNRNAIFCFQ